MTVTHPAKLAPDPALPSAPAGSASAERLPFVRKRTIALPPPNVSSPMSTDSQANRWPSAPLGNRVGAQASASQIAAAVFATWEEIDDALTPIIGPRGVAALYYRSLHLTGATHPCLAAKHDIVKPAINPKALESILAQQESAAAAAAGSAFLQTFHDLLASLIGPTLTERLLRRVWANSLSDAPAQDTTP